MLSAGNIALIALVALVVFKSKDIPKLFGELGQGISNFKRGLGNDVAPQIEEKS